LAGGIILGADLKSGKYWTVDDDTHVLIIGTTRSGKSRRIFMPSIWHLAQMGESMVICDLKKELQPITKEYLKRMGYNIVTLDIRNPSTGNRWNILNPVVEALKESNDALAIQHANDIAHTLSYDPRYRGDPIWPAAKKSLISALILAVAVEAPREHKNMATAFYMLANLGQDGGTGLDSYFDLLPLEHPARSPYAIYKMSVDKMRSSIATDTLSSLQVFGIDPAVVWMVSDQDHELRAPGKDKTAVFLIIPDERTNRNVLASLYIQQSYGALVDLANQNKGRLPLRVNYLLDEFGNIPGIADFTTKITTAGGRGIRFILAVQGIDQLSEHYPDKENTIMGQCWTWIYLLTADQKTAELISAKTGNYTVATESYNSSAQMSGSYSNGVTQGLTSRPLVMKDEVMRWPEDYALILRTRLFPAKLPLPDISRWPIARELDLDRNGEPDPEKPVSILNPWIPTASVKLSPKQRKNNDNKETRPSAGNVLGF